jgi:simple sugar transport system permease protein
MMDDTAIGLWGVPLAIFAGAIRVSTPFIFVSLGETIRTLRPHQSRS